MMCACLGVGANGDGARSELFSACARVIDGGRARHVRSLGRIERVAGDHLDAVFPLVGV